MQTDWQNTTIGEQVRLQRGIDITKAQQRTGSVPVVSSGGVASYHDTAFAKAPGVVLGRKGNVGTVFYITDDYWPHDTSLWVTDFRGNNAQFVYYFFLSIADELRSLDVGSANPALNRNHVHPIQILWPKPDEQRTIARMLGALDDKIELNRRMNQTLEELAEALFRSWFVDFDPVVAKAAGRKPFGLAPEVAALFPAAFTDSPLGPIPQGWRVQPIGDVVRTVGGSTPPTGEPRYWSGGEIAWATPRDLSNLSDPVLLSTERQITPAGLGRITSGLLPAGTVLLSSRAPIGYTAITEIPLAVNQGFIALDCNGALPNHYVFGWVRENMETIEAHANGTTFMEISKANFRPILAIVPTPEILAQFSGIVAPWWRQIAHNVRESLTLAALRDTLLPKLLSGEIRVGDAGKP